MKRLKLQNHFIALVALVLACTFASCGDDIYYTIDNTDEALCNKLWIEDHYVTSDGQEATYQLRFNTIDRQISWRWTDDSKECIQLIYNDGSAQYLENVWVRDHYLSAEVDGLSLTFVDANHRY